MKPETRVIVEIKDPERYAMGCAAKLDGKRGKIDRVRTDPNRGEMALVEFDTPADKWWSNQLPVECFWFSVSELRSEP